jgi:hypothetical protein
MHYYSTWQEAAKRGLVPDAKTLTPDDAHRVPYPIENGAEVLWKDLYSWMNPGAIAARASSAASAKAREEQAKSQAKAAEASASPAMPAPTPPAPETTPAKAPEPPTIGEQTPPETEQPPAVERQQMKQYSLGWALQEKVIAVAAEQGVTETHIVREAVREWLKQETPPKLDE